MVYKMYKSGLQDGCIYKFLILVKMFTKIGLSGDLTKKP